MKPITAAFLLLAAGAATAACREEYRTRDDLSRTTPAPPPARDLDVTVRPEEPSPDTTLPPAPVPPAPTDDMGAASTGVDWTSYSGNIRFAIGSKGLDAADKEDRPSFVFYTQQGCTVCSDMASVAFKDPKVSDLVNSRFKAVLVDVRSTEGDDEDWVKQHGATSTPRIVFADEDGKLISSLDGAQTADAIVDAANAALARLDKDNELQKK